MCVWVTEGERHGGNKGATCQVLSHQLQLPLPDALTAPPVSPPQSGVQPYPPKPKPNLFNSQHFGLHHRCYSPRNPLSLSHSHTHPSPPSAIHPRFVCSFRRPNLHLSAARRGPSMEGALSDLLARKAASGRDLPFQPTLVYALTTAQVWQLDGKGGGGQVRAEGWGGV